MLVDSIVGFFYNQIFVLQNVLFNIAFLFHILFLYLAIKEKKEAWIFSLISYSILSYLFFIGKIYLSFIFAICYIIISIDGFFYWKKKDDKGSFKHKIYDYTIKSHFTILFIVILVSFFLSNFLYYLFKIEHYTLYSIVFSLGLVALYLLLRKSRLNWIYWIAYNILAIIYFILIQDYQFIAINVVYLVMSWYGYIKWKLL